jgi:hypothetical protein
MQTLTIAAASRESAFGFHAALSDFRTELIEKPDGPYEIKVVLGRSDREIIDVLNTIELYVTRRASGPAQIELSGHSYVLHAVQDADAGTDDL